VNTVNEAIIYQEQLGQPTPVPKEDYSSPYPLFDILPGRRRSSDIIKVEDLERTPGFPKVKLTGFFQADAASFLQDKESLATFGNIQDVRGFRRTRLAAIGDVTQNVSYMLEMDFAFPGRPSFMDVWMDVHSIPLLGNVRVGQWRMPFGMDELTSVRELQFIERGITFGMAPFRQIGVGFHDTNAAKTVTWNVAGFGFPTDFWGDSFGDRGYGMAARLTALPIYDDEEDRYFHLGFDYSLLNSASGTIFFRNQPEFGGPFGGVFGNTANFAVPFFVNTGTLNSNWTNLLNAEAAFGIGSWYVQSEYRCALVDLDRGGVAYLPMLYVQSGYFLTGEVRPYDKTNAVFGRVKPRNALGEGGIGAWEVTARYSYANFNSFQNAISGNELSDITFGLNWFLNQYAKFQFNYIHSFVNAPGLHSNTDIFAVRAQLDF